MVDLCCSTLGAIGDWNIYVKVPVLVPARIKFNWNDGTGWQETEGDSYQITNENEFIDGVCVPATAPTYWRDSNPNRTIKSVGIGTGTSFCVWDSVSAEGLCPLTNYGNNNPSHPQTSNYNWSKLFNRGPIVLHSDAKGFSHNWDNPYSDNSGQVCYKITFNEINYTLKIYKGSTLTYSQTKKTNPTVSQVPKSCPYPTDWSFVNTYQNFNQSDYCLTYIERNKAWLNLMNRTPNGLYAPKVLAFAQSPDDCPDPPQFKVECKPYRRCPNGSCEIICGDTICCTDTESGEIVDSFPANQLY